MFSDAQGNIARHPMSATWPAQTLATTTLTEADGQTTLTLHYLPHEANATEVATFEASFAGLQVGWAGTFDQLEAYLAELAKRP
jgi:uncharacterized protein YndB with AHSA1/START domain